MERHWDVAARSLGVPPDPGAYNREQRQRPRTDSGKKPSETDGFYSILLSPPVIVCCQGDLHLSELGWHRSADEEWLT